MKRIDFEHGTVTGNILGAALPMLVAQILNLLYNIVDRIYIARIPNIGTAALGAVGLCFPLIVVITAFSNLFGSGGAPLFSIYRGKGEPQRAANVMNTSFTMVCVCAVVLMAVGFIFARPLLVLFGASTDALVYAYPYLMIYLIGTLPSMIATGMNPFINAQGYSTIGMTSVAVGAVANLLLDPLFIFVLGFGVQGAAIATVISQALSAVFVFVFLTRKSELKVRFLKKKEFSECIGYAKNIVSLGTAGFIMQLTNSLVSICCNNILSDVGGDIYISVMTIVSSVRQLVETPIYAMNEGTSPILSYNYGACRPARVRKAMAVMSTMILGYTAVMWSIIILFPNVLIGIFSSDAALMQDAVPALKQYFAAFICMDFQYIGQTVFKSLNKKKQAIFFSLLRKVFIVVPLTYMMPYMFHMGTAGVFLAEPVSNVIGGTLCLVVMLCTILPELKRMEKQNSKNVLQ
jgi:putative MATE family efflux protein